MPAAAAAVVEGNEAGGTSNGVSVRWQGDRCGVLASFYLQATAERAVASWGVRPRCQQYVSRKAVRYRRPCACSSSSSSRGQGGV